MIKYFKKFIDKFDNKNKDISNLLFTNIFNTNNLIKIINLLFP